MLRTLGFLALLLPYGWEVDNDRNGDLDKKRDVWIRAAYTLIGAGFDLLAILYSDMIKYSLGLTFEQGLYMYGKALFMSAALHFLLFDYTIAAVLGHKDWYSYLGEKSKIDNLKAWRGMGPHWRFVMRLVVLAVALILYF